MKKEKVKSTNKTTKTVKTKRVRKTKDEGVVVIKDEIFNKKTRKGIYFSFGVRMTVNVILLLIFLGVMIFSFAMSFAITKKEIINYSETSNIDYKIYLKDNNFYENDYLEKGMVYIASLIDKIHVNFNYYFNVGKNGNLDVKYKIKGKLTVASQANSNVFYTKDYDLSKEVVEEIKDGNKFTLNDKTIVIDYGYYNGLANDFKNKYAVNTDSKLEVYLEIEEKSKDGNSYELSNSNKVVLVIPLSQQEVNISLEDQNINSEKQIINNPKFIVKDLKYIAIFGLSIIFSFILLLALINKINVLIYKEETEFDKFVDKLLRGYDRIIITVKTAPNFDNCNVIKVESFQELIDVRDNTNQPINYYLITNHQKCEFFVINKNNVYVYVVKDVDLNR